MRMKMWSVGKNKADPRAEMSSEAGFTLLEILVVLGIMVMAYTLAVPVFANLLPSVTLNATAEQVVSDLRQARAQAILSGKSVIFTLHDNGAEYALSGQKKSRKVEGALLSFVNKTREEITFTPDGKNDGFMLVLQTEGRERKINSDWITGRISLVKEQGEGL